VSETHVLALYCNRPYRRCRSTFNASREVNRCGGGKAARTSQDRGAIISAKLRSRAEIGVHQSARTPLGRHPKREAWRWRFRMNSVGVYGPRETPPSVETARWTPKAFEIRHIRLQSRSKRSDWPYSIEAASLGAW
jgi:hypothetical protein